MQHAEHFLSRLVRLADDEIKLALALYHDSGWVREILQSSGIPDAVPRVADLAWSWTPGSPACGQRDRHHADTEIAVADSGIGAMRTAGSPPCGHVDRSCGQPDRWHVDTQIGRKDSQIAA
jgi:hypothetical protein